VSEIINLGGRPSDSQLRRYAESQAYRLIQTRGFLPHERNITAAFRSSALTNLGSVSDWVFELVSIVLAHLRGETLDGGRRLYTKVFALSGGSL
jgi:hypothetical protein